MGSASITLCTANETLGHSTIQWNLVNIYGHQWDMPQCPYYPGVCIKWALRENVRNTCFIDIKTKADSFTNQGLILVEVCGKAVNQGGGLGMEIPCVYIFDGPRKHVDLLEQLLDVSNNPSIRAEDDHGTARSKQTTSKRKKVKSNDCNKKPRK